MAASPFPGMDPYLERTWRDVHHRLITYTTDLLQPLLAPGLRARMEERVILESPEEYFRRRNIFPDVHLFAKPPAGALPPVTPPESWGEQEGGGLAVAEPVVMVLEMESPIETFIQITDARSGGEVVTVIEFLSPGNKEAGASRDQYLQKRGELLCSTASLVEIDLVREGERFFPTADRAADSPTRKTAYAACVHRVSTGSRFELYPLPLRERLPILRIPQRPGEPDVLLDVQAVVDLAYRNGRYDEDIDYRQTPPGPPLPSDEAMWAGVLLHAAGRRTE